jgi:putative MATE family efflux protein
MLVNLLSNILNVILNYILIYKVALGVKGAAISTAISSVLCGLAMFALMMKNSNLRTPVRLKVEKPILKETVKIGFPVMATTMVSCFGHVVFASLVSSMGTTVFAAHSIALSAETIFYLPGYGLRSATSTLIGISVGENSYDKFKTVVRQSVLLTVGMMAFTGLVLFITASQIMAIFSPDEEVIALGARVLRLVAISEPIFGLMIVSEGIYYGMGQTKTAFIVTTIGSWGIRIVSTVICVYVLHTGLFEIWICMLADNTFRALAMAIPLFSGGAKRHFYKRRREFEISC